MEEQDLNLKDSMADIDLDQLDDLNTQDDSESKPPADNTVVPASEDSPKNDKTKAGEQTKQAEVSNDVLDDNAESIVGNPAEDLKKATKIYPFLEPAKVLDNKRKILNRVKSKDYDNAVKLYYETFHAENQPDIDFLSSLYLEFSKNQNYEVFYSILVTTKAWISVNSVEFKAMYADVKRLYIEDLVLKGNNFLYERNERVQYIKKNSRRGVGSGSLKDDKLLLNYNRQAMNCFKTAYELDPENISALNCLKDCYDFAGDTVNLKKTLQAINEKMIANKNKLISKEAEEAEREEEEDAEAREQLRAYEELQKKISEGNRLYEEGQYEEFLNYYDEVIDPENPDPTLMLIRARTMAQLKRFRESSLIVRRVEKIAGHLPEMKEAVAEINSIKESLYRKAAYFYLNRALAKGALFSQEDFLTAKQCLTKVLATCQTDIDTYDMYYTVLKYLKEDDEAFKIKGIMFSLDSEFVPTFNRLAKNKMCFIASYAYFDNPSDIEVFRWFRREFLLGNSYGRLVNCLYIRYSPFLVELAAKYRCPSIIFKALLFIPLNLIKLLQRFLGS